MSADRDWDKELAAIDKVMARPAAAPGKPAVQGSGGAVAAPAAAPIGRRAALFTWVRVGLAVAVAAGMTQWPYLHNCGTSLFIYLGAVATVVVAGLWSSITSWQRRMGWAHAIALGVTLWGLILGAQAILPRIGYARIAAHWWCP
ncbi:MAG TPA: hypothetical protein VMJ30_08680 [Gemmatimonadales bacterium]|nr:hypothetical protein [Gemmatimonadales bacterium]